METQNRIQKKEKNNNKNCREIKLKILSFLLKQSTKQIQIFLLQLIEFKKPKAEKATKKATETKVIT